MQLNPYQKSLLQLLAFLAVFAGAVIAIGINRPHWRDEAHFVETVRDFGNEINIKSSDLDFLLFIDMAILTFLLMMPFFYLAWEKIFSSGYAACCNLSFAEIPEENLINFRSG